MLSEAESTHWLNQFKKAKNVNDFLDTITGIKNLHHDKHKKVGPMQHSPSKLTSSNEEKAKVINDFFVKIGKKLAVKYLLHEDELESYGFDRPLQQNDNYNQ